MESAPHQSSTGKNTNFKKITNCNHKTGSKLGASVEGVSTSDVMCDLKDAVETSPWWRRGSVFSCHHVLSLLLASVCLPLRPSHQAQPSTEEGSPLSSFTAQWHCLFNWTF